MYRLVALDLDGTLLSKNRKIPREFIELIKSYSDQGIIFTIATGRFFRSAQIVAGELGLDVPIITANGALVKGCLSEEVLQHFTLSKELAAQVLDFAALHQAMRFVFMEDMIITDASYELTRHYAENLKVKFEYVPDVKNVLDNDPTMVVFRLPEDQAPKLTQLIKVACGESVHLTSSLPFFVEVINKAATKGQALCRLAAQFNVSMSEVIAIGDSYNDMEMVKSAGLGILVANAPEELKQEADFVTHGERNEGVQEALVKFLGQRLR